MTDELIIELLNERNQTALQITQEKYGAYCETIAQNILDNFEDAQECENEALFKLWNAIPPAQPGNLKAFLGRITRNAALDAYERRGAAKRGGGQVELALEEIAGFVSDGSDVERTVESKMIAGIINGFLSELGKQQRIIFLRRYLYFVSIGEIAEDMMVSESKVKSVLFRLRKKLKKILETEGVL